jgi:putative membrane protein
MMVRFKGVLSASPALLMAGLIAKLWLGGTLGYFVNSRTLWIVLAGGALFAVVGIASVWRAVHGDHDHRLSPRTLAFLGPVVFGLVAPAHPLSATSGQASSLGSLQLASHVSSGSPGDDFGTWIADLGAHPDPSWWVGQKITLVGFTAGQNGLPRDSFLVGRYLVTCCVVDAQLMGFPVRIDRGRVPTQGSWVQVSGVFGRDFWTDPTGAHYPVIEHAKLAPVSIPSSPYLSP